MISKVVLDTFRLVLKVGYKLSAFPYKWDPLTEELAPVSRKKLIQWYFLTGYVFINTVFMSVRMVQSALIMGNMTYGKLVLNLFNVVTWTATSVFQLNTLIFRFEVQEFINQVLKTNKYIRNLHWRSDNGETRISESSSVRKFTLFIYFYSTCQFFISVRTFETNPKYFFSLLGRRGTPKWKLVPLGIFEAGMSGCIASMLLFYVFVFLSYVMLSRNCLNSLCKKKSTEVSRFYRMLQVLNAQFNFCSKKLVMPFIFLTLLGTNMITTYATVRLFHEVKMPAYLGFPMVALATTFIVLDTFPNSYKMYEASMKLVLNLKHSGRRTSYLAKFMSSCKPLGVDIGIFFAITQSTTMTFLGIVIDNTIMLLLSF